MCGIAGIVGLERSLREALVKDMSSTIRHRGPDGDGSWSDDSITLAHRRLSILDLSKAGRQPMLSQCGNYVLVFNGEIYNYIEVRQRLEARSWTFRSTGDTEVFLAAYVEYGHSFLELLNGMWAFAIWDLSRKILYAGRDRFGKKPFFYWVKGSTLAFGSEIKALLATGLFQARPNLQSVADFAAERITDHNENTFFKDVSQLPPSSWLTWDSNGLRIGQYWELPNPDEDGQKSYTIEDIKESLISSVKIRLRSDTPVGTLLSGGLDSSGVTGISAKLSQSEIFAFSTLDPRRLTEAEGIQPLLVSHKNVIWRSDSIENVDFVNDFEQCLWHQEQPFADGSMIAHFRLMRKASEEGIKVLLTGQGADELFGGYPGFLEVHLAGLLRKGRIYEAAKLILSLRLSGRSIETRSLLGYLLPAGLRRRLRSRRLDWLGVGCQDVSPSAAAGYELNRRHDALNTALRQCIRQRTLPGFLHYEDRNSMAFGVETRLPFLDYILVEKVLPICGIAKLRNGVTKSILRAVLKEFVPRMTRKQTIKEGYPAPLAIWLRKSEQTYLERWHPQIQNCPLIRLQSWQLYFQRFLDGDDSCLPVVWRGLVIACWYNRFIGAGKVVES